MGGHGSGGHNSEGRITTDQTMRLDVRELRRHGCLIPGRQGSIEWTLHDGSRASMAFNAHSDEIELRWTQSDTVSGEVKSMADWLALEWRPCRFGGVQPFFACDCGALALALYLRDGRFCCRACAGVVYASQNERQLHRTRRAAQKIRYRLGGSSSPDDGIPERPKGMWRRTYDRMVARLIAAEEAEAEALLPIMQKMLARYG
jgi:hypothetical protein